MIKKIIKSSSVTADEADKYDNVDGKYKSPRQRVGKPTVMYASAPKSITSTAAHSLLRRYLIPGKGDNCVPADYQFSQ